MNIYNLSYNIWCEIGSPSGTQPPYISGWLVNDVNLGKLNTLLATCFSGINGSIQPTMQNDEAAIYGEVYKTNYYGRKVSESLGANGIQWVAIKEGDSEVRRASPTENSKLFLVLKKESDINLKDLVSRYRMNHAGPAMVNFDAP